MTATDQVGRLRIGEAAARLGLNPKTIRYYEEIGLLPAPARTAAGYRLYGDDDLERLRFVGQAKAVGLSLDEIGEILALRRSGEQPCHHVLGLLDRKLAAVEEQLRALREVQEELVALRAEASRTARTDACVCGIIERHEASVAVVAPPLSPGRRRG